MSRLSRECEILNISQPYRPPQHVTGIALLFFYFTYFYSFNQQTDIFQDIFQWGFLTNIFYSLRPFATFWYMLLEDYPLSPISNCLFTVKNKSSGLKHYVLWKIPAQTFLNYILLQPENHNSCSTPNDYAGLCWYYGGYEEFYLLRYNACSPKKINQCFRRTCSSEESVDFQWSLLYYIPEDKAVLSFSSIVFIPAWAHQACFSSLVYLRMCRAMLPLPHSSPWCGS
jgi:hypothetical protein